MPLITLTHANEGNEDDGPIQANTPSSSLISLSNSRVVAGGNRVLDIIGAHIQDVRNRNARHKRMFKEKLLQLQHEREVVQTSRVPTSAARQMEMSVSMFEPEVTPPNPENRDHNPPGIQEEEPYRPYNLTAPNPENRDHNPPRIQEEEEPYRPYIPTPPNPQNRDHNPPRIQEEEEPHRPYSPTPPNPQNRDHNPPAIQEDEPYRPYNLAPPNPENRDHNPRGIQEEEEEEEEPYRPNILRIHIESEEYLDPPPPRPPLNRYNQTTDYHSSNREDTPRDLFDDDDENEKEIQNFASNNQSYIDDRDQPINSLQPAPKTWWQRLRESTNQLQNFASNNQSYIDARNQPTNSLEPTPNTSWQRLRESGGFVIGLFREYMFPIIAIFFIFLALLLGFIFMIQSDTKVEKLDKDGAEPINTIYNGPIF